MREFCYVIKNKNGLHARPAGVLSTTARTFESDVTIYADEKMANGKRLLSVMSLGAECGATLRFEIEGVDEEKAENALKEACQSCLD